MKNTPFIWSNFVHIFLTKIVYFCTSSFPFSWTTPLVKCEGIYPHSRDLRLYCHFPSFFSSYFPFVYLPLLQLPFLFFFFPFSLPIDLSPLSPLILLSRLPFLPFLYSFLLHFPSPPLSFPFPLPSPFLSRSFFSFPFLRCPFFLPFFSSPALLPLSLLSPFPSFPSPFSLLFFPFSLLSLLSFLSSPFLFFFSFSLPLVFPGRQVDFPAGRCQGGHCAPCPPPSGGYATGRVLN